MSNTINFTQTEAMLCTVSNLITEDKAYWIAIGGLPLMAMMLARRTHAPEAFYVVEDGTVSPQPPAYVPFITGASGLSAYRAIAWKDMNTMGFHCAVGYYDMGILDCLQVDMYGNINSTFLGGTYEQPKRRFGGPGGANEILSMCWGTIILAELDKRNYPKRVEFISSPGYLDGTPNAREKAGLPANTGPTYVVADSAIFGFDEKTHRMKVISIAPWITLDEVRASVDFELLVPPQIEVMKPPSEEQLTIVRADIDPTGRAIGAGKWIEYTPKE